MKLANVLEARPVLKERGAPTGALLTQAQNAGMTFGCEAEFYISGVHEVFKKLIVGDAKKDEHGRLLKPLGSLTFTDIQLYCYPLRGTPKEAQYDNNTVITRRVTATFKRMIDPTPVDPSEMWMDLVDRFGPTGALMLCGLFPSNGFAVSATENNYLKKEFNDFLAQPSRSALHAAMDNDHLEISLLDKNEKEDSIYKLDNTGFGREAIMTEMAKLIGTYLGEPVVVSLDPDSNAMTSQGYTRWLLTTDGSLKLDDQHDTIGVELISPKSPLATGYQHVEKLFDLINDFGRLTGVKGLHAFTAENTGFHMNLGLPDKKIDYVKLLTLIGDDYIIKKFGRSNNVNTIPTFKNMVRNFKTSDAAVPTIIDNFEKVIPIDQTDINYIIDALSKSVIKNKFQSVNLTKLIKHGYVEFRALGNKDYQMRIDDVKQSLTTFATMMYAATDPNVYRKEYLSKIYKIIKTAADSAGDPIQGQVGPNKQLITMINTTLKNQLIPYLERTDRVVSRKWFTVNELLKQYSKTGRINTYAFRQECNNLLSSIRLAHAEGRISISTIQQKLLKDLILSLRKIGNSIKGAK